MWQLEENNNLKYFRLTINEAGLENLLCFFSTRQCDDNFRNFSNIGINRIFTLYQIHSDIIWYVNQEFTCDHHLTGDGLFTDQTNTFIGVKVADCLPIYFFSPIKKIVGVVHSGWRGTLKEIGSKMVKTLLENFNLLPSQLYYAFGPAIAVCCYEIKQDVLQLFENFCNEKKIIGVINHRNGKYYLDLKRVNKIILERLGVKQVGDLDLCSCCQKELFYSARREKDTGRNLALIGYKK